MDGHCRGAKDDHPGFSPYQGEYPQCRGSAWNRQKRNRMDRKESVRLFFLQESSDQI